MPISHSWLNNDLAQIIEGLAGIELSGSGGAAYRYAASAKISLQAGRQITLVPAVKEKVNREVSIYLLSGTIVSLSWGDSFDDHYNLLKLDEKNPTFKDLSDGGMRLNIWSEADAEIEVIVRSDKPIDYKLGEVEAVTLVGCRLLVDTTRNYADNISDLDIALKIQELTGSDEMLEGHKLFQITGFKPHEELTFNVDASSTTNYTGVKIDVQWLSQVDVAKLLMKVGLNSFLSVTVPYLISGQGELGECFTHAALIPSVEGGEVILKPDYGHNIGRFVARNILDGVSDTCVITNYTPNAENPQQGGTFTLGGF